MFSKQGKAKVAKKVKAQLKRKITTRDYIFTQCYPDFMMNTAFTFCIFTEYFIEFYQLVAEIWISLSHTVLSVSF